MKKWMFSFAFFCIIGNTLANDTTNCCNSDCTCVWSKNGTELTITATENNVYMQNYSNKYGNGEYITTAPWGTDITSVKFVGNIKSVGSYAFYHAHNLTSIDFPDSIISIGSDVLNGATGLTHIGLPDNQNFKSIPSFFASNTSLETFVIPQGITYIGSYAIGGDLCGGSLPSTRIGGCSSTFQSLVIEGTPTISTDAFRRINGSETIYCLNPESCQNKGQGENVTVKGFTKTDEGFYVLGEGENAQYFLSPELMAKQETPLNATQYRDFLQAFHVNKSFVIGGKLYNSLSDFISGNYEKKRIYTVEEATWLTQHNKGKNTFTLKYR